MSPRPFSLPGECTHHDLHEPHRFHKYQHMMAYRSCTASELRIQTLPNGPVQLFSISYAAMSYFSSQLVDGSSC